ncbi:fibronectin type III domain-containing protein [Nostocoides japonicum]|uniref:fibronectin type III domain-containing protein n=1 Tax=Nostocoides japonicum TaxID=99481 RepID=UPI00138F613F|nr:fibronectin type III domain-containing protein [Tetrasphaera japonica]
MISAILLLSGLAVSPANADVGAAPARTWGTNGRVLSILSLGGRVYIAGTFTSVIDPSSRTYPVSNIAVFDPSSGRFDTSWPVSADNTVTSLATSGGKLFLAGLFSKVNGVKRTKLAKVDALTGALDSTWTPKINRQPDSMTTAGDEVYVSGLFTQAAGSGGTLIDRPHVARFSTDTGSLDTTWQPTPNNRVYAVQVSADQQSVYLGGTFTSVNGTSTPSKIVRLSASSGSLVPGFAPGATNQTTRGPVYGIAVSGTRLYLAVGGAGGACAAMDGQTGTVAWSKHTNGNLQAVTLVGGTVYCGGHFTGDGAFDGQTRYKLASVDAASGTTLPFAPVINSALGVWSLASDATHVYVGGDFTKIGSTDQPQFAEFPDSAALTAPGAPETVSCSPGDSVAMLQWFVPSTDGGQPLRSYSVYRSTDQTTWAKIGNTTDPAYADTAATNGTTYSYRVTAVNAIGESAPSTTVTCTPQPASATPPAAPGNFAAMGVPNATSLSWTAPANGGSQITAYRVYRGDGPGTETLLATTTGATTGYVDSAVTIGSRYYYRVSAINAVGESPLSAEDSASPTDGAPAAPVMTGTSGPDGITLNWTAPKDNGSPITKYVLTRDGIRIATFPATQFSYVDAGVTPGTNYTYRLKAQNAMGNSPLSKPVVISAQ